MLRAGGVGGWASLFVCIVFLPFMGCTYWPPRLTLAWRPFLGVFLYSVPPVWPVVWALYFGLLFGPHLDGFLLMGCRLAAALVSSHPALPSSGLSATFVSRRLPLEARGGFCYSPHRLCNFPPN